MTAGRDPASNVLRWLLRLTALALMAAVVGVFMPRGWMVAAQEHLGLPPDDGPVFDYLARSTSAFYALVGGLAWLASGDLARYRALIAYLGFAAVVCGVGVTAVDLLVGLPWYWTWSEGPGTVALGLAVLVLLRRSEKRPAGPG